MQLRRLLIVSFLLACLTSCEAKRPMSRDEIYDAQQAVPTLYRTEAGREFIAPGNKFGATVDPESKQLAWATWKCDNPDCPAKDQGRDGRPFLFIWPNFLAYVKEDATLGFHNPSTDEDMRKFEIFAEPGCPECLKLRDKSKETPEQRQQYQNWATKYVLPEAEARIKELDAEWQKYLDREKQRKQQAGR